MVYNIDPTFPHNIANHDMQNTVHETIDFSLLVWLNVIYEGEFQYCGDTVLLTHAN